MYPLPKDWSLSIFLYKCKYDYNIADDSSKETSQYKTFEKIVWNADGSNEFAGSLKRLGAEDKLTELLQKEEIDVDKTQGFISGSLLKAVKILTNKITVLPTESKTLPQVV